MNGDSIRGYKNAVLSFSEKKTIIFRQNARLEDEAPVPEPASGFPGIRPRRG
jgi:hypothetical protein